MGESHSRTLLVHFCEAAAQQSRRVTECANWLGLVQLHSTAEAVVDISKECARRVVKITMNDPVCVPLRVRACARARARTHGVETGPLLVRLCAQVRTCVCGEKRHESLHEIVVFDKLRFKRIVLQITVLNGTPTPTPGSLVQIVPATRAETAHSLLMLLTY